jgi:peptidoglycan-associated lipoprotein
MEVMGKRLVVVVVAALLIVVGGAGCSSKKKGVEAGAGAGAGAGGVGEEGLGSAGSLDRARHGLAPGEEGPLQDIPFAFDSYEIDEASRAILRDNGNWLKDHPQAKVEIEGHCDERGTVEFNLALGAKRASAAKEYLVALGVAADRLTTISYGEELPLCHEHTEECWQRNRRAHFVVLSE